MRFEIDYNNKYELKKPNNHTIYINEYLLIIANLQLNISNNITVR